MEQRLNCEIVQDLLPSYIDHMTSEGTSHRIKEHLEGCQECSEIYEQMTKEVEITPVKEVQEVKQFLLKTKIKYGIMVLAALCAVGIIVCLIVNLAIDRSITWSFIPAMGIIYGYAGIHVLAVSKRHPWIRSLLTYSILLIPLLWSIEFGAYYLMNTGGLWFFSYGLPIALVWLAITWISVFAHLIFKWNVLYCLAVLCMLGIPGNWITNQLVGESGLSIMINSICSGILAVVCLAGGMYMNALKKK